jgi:heterodisulfide reductase subunit A
MPVEKILEFDLGLGTRSHLFSLPQAVRSGHCRRCTSTGKCRACEKFCTAKAIDFEQTEQHVDIEVGTIILATGFKDFTRTHNTGMVSWRTSLPGWGINSGGFLGKVQ